MPGKTKVSSYCIVRDSEKLLMLIKMKMNEKGKTISGIAEDIDTDVSNVRKYLNKGEHSISQQKVLTMAAFLGISVGLNIEVV